MRTTYQINEIFTTIQGEGAMAGSPATFIRLQGCTVGCPWCDTKYTWAKGGTRMTVEEIVARIDRYHVVITGGEPTLYDLDALLEGIHAKQHFTQIETSGQQALKGSRLPNWLTWSPKENLRWTAPIAIAGMANEVKWVVDEALPFDHVQAMWKEYRALLTAGNIRKMPFFVFMPEGCPPRSEMIDRAMGFLSQAPEDSQLRWFYGDRIQWRIGVK